MERTVKITTTVALFYLIMSVACFGRIGDTKAQSDERYGKPVAFGEMLLYSKGDNLIMCHFKKDICISMWFLSKNGKWSTDEFIAMLKENTSGGQQWFTLTECERLHNGGEAAWVDAMEHPSKVKHFPSPGEPLGCMRSDGILAFASDDDVFIAASPGSSLVKSLGEDSTAPREAVWSDEVLAMFAELNLNKFKQKIFENIHPTGTAKNIVVHECKADWKGKGPTANLDDLNKYTVRFTIYWEGPVEKDGYTKVSATFDGEVKRFTESHVLATNGITNGDVSQAMLMIGTELFKGAIQRQQQSN